MHFSFASKSSFLHSHFTRTQEALFLSSAMADSSPYTKPHFTFSQTNSPVQPKPIINKGKSYSGFLLKSFFVALFVVVLPLFPTQAPDFVNQTILTKLWELLHLLFIGVAVAYGLFSRRHVEPDIEVETHPTVDNTSCYVSTMFPVSSMFGDECENPCGSDENRMMMHCNWNFSQYYENSTVMVMGEQCKPQVPLPEDDFSDVMYDGANVVQAWNSEYHHRQPMVVVAQPYYTIGECDEIVGHKPLGLPVRSLRSTTGDLDSPSNANESDSSSGSRSSSRSSVKSGDGKFGDLDLSDLDQKFNDAAGSASHIPWHSRSRRMKIEVNHGHFSDAAASVSSIPWHERSKRVEIDESHAELGDVTGSASPIPWQAMSKRMQSEGNHEKCNDVRRMKIEVNHGHFSDAAASASSIPWHERSKRVEIDESHGELDDVTGSASPIPWQAMSKRMQSEGNHETCNDVAGSFPPIQWQECCRRMEIEENHREFKDVTGSASPIPWQTRSRAMEIEENHRMFNDAPGSASPIPWHSRSRRMESEENHGSITRPSHFRPLSVDETKLELLSSQVFKSTTSFSSHTSTYSSSDSILSDNMNLEAEEMGEMGQKKTSDGSSSEKMNFKEEDSAENLTSLGSSPRIRKMATREKYAAVSRPSHFKPVSVDETQFESLSSQSFQSTGSFSSRTSLFSSLDSAPSENLNLPKEDSGENKNSHGPSSNSPSPPARRRNGEASLQTFHSRGYSVGSLLQDGMKSGLKDEWLDLNGKEGEDQSCNKEAGLHLPSDTEKPTSLAKAPTKGKSVRTRRASGLTSETLRTGDICSKQTDEKVEKKPDNVESVLMRREKLRKGGPGHLLKGISKQNVNPPCPKLEVTFSSYPKRDKEEPSKNVAKEDSLIELENFQMNSHEDRVSECANDSGLDSEVDKKASEFIAKFKAQIRLQKDTSMDRSRGLRTMKKILGDT